MKTLKIALASALIVRGCMRIRGVTRQKGVDCSNISAAMNCRQLYARIENVLLAAALLVALPGASRWAEL